METESDFEEERILEVEDFDFSDDDILHEKSEVGPINIDYNSRITKQLSTEVKLEDTCIHEKLSDLSRFQLSDWDVPGETSCEELEVSDEDLPNSDFLNMQTVILDGICCFASNRHSDAVSSYNSSSTSFKNDYTIDAEYAEDDTNVKVRESMDVNSFGKIGRRMISGLPVNITPSFKDGISVSLALSNVDNSYSSSILLKRRPSDTLLDAEDAAKSSLMTCLEFLKSEHSDEEGTDVEEFSMDLGDLTGIEEENVYNCLELPQNDDNIEGLENDGEGGVTNFFDLYKGRKSSMTTEILVDDESSQGENDANPIKMNSNQKRLSNAGEYEQDCPTDEEDLDLVDLKEWTETDESGDVRQITQIKTETSIKLEGDGDGSAFDSDDLVSTTTATTTTRVVTSVITNPDEGSDIDSTFVQQVSEDGIRQSCEITFSEVLNDSSNLGESGCEE